MQQPYLIRRAQPLDRLLLAQWRSRPHITRWWGDPGVEPQAEKVGAPLVAAWIAELDDRPFAFIQDYAVSDWPPHHFDYLPVGSRGMDLYIGELDLIGQGHGPRLVRQHADALLSAGAPAVGIDPHPDNLAAQRAFEKAGFTLAGGPMETRWGRAVLMDRRA